MLCPGWLPRSRDGALSFQIPAAGPGPTGPGSRVNPPFLNAARGESDSGMPGRSCVLDRRVNLTDAVSQIGMIQEGVDELS